MGQKPLMISIRDLGVVAVLVTCGFEVMDTYLDPTGRMYFVFQETNRLGSVMDSYYADTLRIKARKFFDNTKMLKARIYSER